MSFDLTDYDRAILTGAGPWTVVQADIQGTVIGQLMALENLNSAAQTGILTFTENGGTVRTLAALGASQIISWPPPGAPFYHDLTISSSTALTAPGIAVYFRKIY